MSTANAWTHKEVQAIIENHIAAQQAVSKRRGFPAMTAADRVLASYTLWEARLSSHGWMVKCVASEPTSADFARHVKKSEIKQRLNADGCAPAYIVERKDKGNATTPKVSFNFYSQL